MDNVTAIIVSYNTPDLLRACVESIRKFYPALKIIIIDGSPPDSDCWIYCHKLMQEPNTLVKCVEYNIGHGNGVKMGISMCETEYFLLVDSDVEILSPILEDMLIPFKKGDCYGVGEIISVDENGNNGGNILYLHPHFALINKEKYLKHSPIMNHGAPMLNAMKSISNVYDCGLAFCPDFKNRYVHHERGTRKLNPKEFNPVNWDKV